MTKLWLVKRTDRISYDEYDSMVVAAETQDEARFIHPSGYVKASVADGRWNGWVWDVTPDNSLYGKPYQCKVWPAVSSISVEYLGTTDRDIKGVVLASFNAG